MAKTDLRLMKVALNPKFLQKFVLYYSQILWLRNFAVIMLKVLL